MFIFLRFLHAGYALGRNDSILKVKHGFRAASKTRRTPYPTPATITLGDASSTQPTRPTRVQRYEQNEERAERHPLPLCISGSEKQARQGKRPTSLLPINPWRCEQYTKREHLRRGVQLSLPQHSPKRFCKKIFGEEEAPPQQSRQPRLARLSAKCGVRRRCDQGKTQVQHSIALLI